MRRPLFDVLKRAFDNTIANWQIILLRFGEMLLFGALAVLTLIAIVVPVLVSVGISVMKLHTLEDFESAMLALAEGWMVLIWIFVAICFLVLVYIAIHSFVEAGCARVYVDAERVAGPDAGLRNRFEVFSMERWMSGGRSGWWAVFWIYNLAWGLGGLILLIPLVPTIALMLFFNDGSPRAAITTGCLGLVVTLFLGIAVAIVTGMWTTRAIADWAVHRAGARDALGHAWQAIKGDLARHLVIMLAVFAVAIAGSMVFSSFSMFAAFGDVFSRNTAHFVTLPIRMVGQLLSMIFSGAVTSWYLASYASLAVEDHS